MSGVPPLARVAKDDTGSVTKRTMRKKKPYHNKKWLRRQYITMRKSACEIAEAIGISHKVILKYLRRYRIPIRTLSQAQEVRNIKAIQEKPYRDKNWLHEQYIDKEKSASAIAKECSVSGSLILHYLKRFNIPVRTHSEQKRRYWDKRLKVLGAKILKRYQQIAKKRGGILLSTKYRGAAYKYRFRCRYKHKFDSRLDGIRKGTFCPECSVSYSEKICREILEKMTGKTFTKYRLRGIQGGPKKRYILDGFNKELQLAFEYNGEQHVKRIKHWHRSRHSFLTQKRRDMFVRNTCRRLGISLIEIPYNIEGVDKLSEYLYGELKKRGLQPVKSNIKVNEGGLYRKPLYYGKDYLLNQYITLGKSAKGIAEELSCDPTTVSHALERCGIPLRSDSEAHKMIWDRQAKGTRLTDKKWLNMQYVTLKRTATDIAQELGCGRPRLLCALIKHRIPVRNRDEALDLFWVKTNKGLVCKDKKWLKAQYVTLGRNASSIAEELGCSVYRLYYALNKHGIPLRSRSESNKLRWNKVNKRILYKDRKWLSTQYVVRGRSVPSIAKELGCSNFKIYNALGRHGIPIRDASEASNVCCDQRNKGTLLANKKWLNRQYVTLGRSASSIAKWLGCSRDRLNHTLVKQGIPLRTSRCGKV